MLSSLLNIANELDALGLHKEANVLDRILQKKADVLMYKEKPFLAQLARIMMALEKYKSGERIKESITFPNSDVNLFGLTKQAAVEKVQKHLKMFIDQFLVPNLDRRYKGTKYEDQYRQFVALVYDLYQTLEGLFASKSEQQSIREGLNAIEQVKRMVGQLIVFIRTRELSKGVKEQEAEDNLREGVQTLNKMEMAVKQLDEKVVKELIHDLFVIFPRKGDSPTSRVVIDAYNSENIPFIRQSVIEEEAKSRTSLELLPELETAESSYKRYNQEIARKKDVVGRTEDLEKRLQRLKEEAAKYDFKTKRMENFREFELKVKTEAFTYEPPRRASHIKNKYRRYEVIAGDLSNLQKWLEQYKKRPDLDQVVSFSDWISKFDDASAANKAFAVINANIADLKIEAENDLRAAEDARDHVELDLAPLRTEWQGIKSQVVWDMWYDQYMVRLVQTLNHVLAPETRGQTTSEEAFGQALGGFNKVLNYRI